jgi:CheY-like chemotaxis protein/HPt (histidine-containing phosphotransfer) domain-containing protein
MGGDISVESEPGRGSTFRFRVLAGVVEACSLASPEAGGAFLEGRRVLLVTRAPETGRVLAGLLRRRGAVVREAPGVGEAAEALRSPPLPDLLLVDRGAPGASGGNPAALLGEAAGGVRIPLVLLAPLTGVGDPGPLGGRCEAVLTLPLRHSQVREVLPAVLEGRPVARPPRRTGGGDAGPLPPLRILLAEDNPVNRQVCLGMLARFGARADVVADGAAALEAAARGDYDVVLMDVHMPGMDGLEAARALRRDRPRGGRPRIIAMTAGATVEDRAACERAGMEDFVAKPIRAGEFRAALERAAEAVGAGAAARSGEDALLDRGTLAGLRTLPSAEGGSLLREILDLFAGNGPRLAADLRAAAGAGDAPRLARLAHTLRGASANVGAAALARAAGAMEAAAREGDLAEARAHLPEIGSLLDRSLAALRVERER